MSIVDDIFHKCTSGSQAGELTAQNVSLYHASPFAIHCEKFVSQDERDPEVRTESFCKKEDRNTRDA